MVTPSNPFNQSARAHLRSSGLHGSLLVYPSGAFLLLCTAWFFSLKQTKKETKTRKNKPTTTTTTKPFNSYYMPMVSKVAIFLGNSCIPEFTLKYLEEKWTVLRSRKERHWLHDPFYLNGIPSAKHPIKQILRDFQMQSYRWQLGFETKVA